MQAPKKYVFEAWNLTSNHSQGTVKPVTKGTPVQGKDMGLGPWEVCPQASRCHGSATHLIASFLQTSTRHLLFTASLLLSATASAMLLFVPHYL